MNGSTVIVKMNKQYLNSFSSVILCEHWKFLCLKRETECEPCGVWVWFGELQLPPLVTGYMMHPSLTVFPSFSHTTNWFPSCPLRDICPQIFISESASDGS